MDQRSATPKTHRNENFPVASWFIQPALRPHIRAFYAFAREADDIADSPSLMTDDKIARLNGMEATLLGNGRGDPSAALQLRRSLVHTGVTFVHASELLAACRWDAVRHRYRSWANLLDYYRYSVCPVGRYILDLHGESRAIWPASDALCTSLQLLDHLQDCTEDLLLLDRCYIPTDWLEEEHVNVSDILRPNASLGLRRVFDRVLAKNVLLLEAATALPRRVKARRLRMEASVIVNLAHRLHARLEKGDPIATRIRLTKLDFLRASLAAFQSY